jgi:glycosyltransferase involved in cell wall biosynthesis
VTGRARRVLIVANDGLPYPGLPVSGSGLRAWGLGQGLRSRGHDVRFAMPASVATPGLPAGAGGPLLYHDHDFRERIADSGAEILVFQHWVRVGGAADLDFPVVLDLHGPLMIEAAFQRRPDANVEEMARAKLEAFRRADFITCAGDQQRKYFLPWLMLAGGDPTAEAITWIPVSLPPDAPDHHWPSDEVNFVYGGMFLPWQDPSLALTTLVGVLESEGRGRLDFYGAPHPQFEMKIGVFEDLEDRLRASPRVVVHGLRPRDELLEHYRQSYVALDLMRRNNERELAFTTRTVEYLWCGLPVVYADYGELSPLIREYEAGWLADPDDAAGLESLLRELLRDQGEVKRRSANAQQLARERLNWDRTVGPLDDFCRMPGRTRRPSDAPVLVARHAADEVRAELDALRATKSFRMMEPLRRAYSRLRRAPLRRPT